MKYFIIITLQISVASVLIAQDNTFKPIGASVFQEVMLSNIDSVSALFLEQIELDSQAISPTVYTFIKAGGDVQCLHFTNEKKLICTGIRFAYSGFNYGTLMQAEFIDDEYKETAMQIVSGHMLPSDWEYLYDDPLNEPQMVAMHVQTREVQGETEFYIIVQSADGTSYPFSFGLHDELPILLVEP